MIRCEEQIGNCRLILGDCLEVMPMLGIESVDMIWTDPPYGHTNAVGDLLARRGKIMGDRIETTLEPIANDEQGDMRRVVCGMLTEAARVLRKDCCCCCCGGGGGPSPTFAWVAQRMDEGGLSFFHSVIWDKKNPGMGWRYRRQHEMVMISHRRGGRLSWADNGVKQPNIISLSKPREGFHPNEKPIELVEQFIRLHTTEGQTVLDPFMGSGTTLVACAKLGCKGIGIEIHEPYFDIACKRVEQAYRQADMFIPAPAAPKPEQISMEGIA